MEARVRLRAPVDAKRHRHDSERPDPSYFYPRRIPRRRLRFAQARNYAANASVWDQWESDDNGNGEERECPRLDRIPVETLLLLQGFCQGIVFDATSVFWPFGADVPLQKRSHRADSFIFILVFVTFLCAPGTFIAVSVSPDHVPSCMRSKSRHGNSWDRSFRSGGRLFHGH